MHTVSRKQNRAVQALAAALALAVALAAGLPLRARAYEGEENDAYRQELQQQVDEAEQNLNEIQQQLSQAQQNSQNLREQLDLEQQKKQLILGQINDISAQMEILSGQIAQVDQDITAKQAEVDAKQAEFDERWAGFKERMAGMQMLNDGGSIALLSNATNLYELLTFSQTLQDIADRDQQICQELEDERAALNEEKQELEDTRAALDQQRIELEDLQAQLENKQQQLASSIQSLNGWLSDAQALEQALSESESDAERAYQEAVYALDSYLNSKNQQYSDQVANMEPNSSGFSPPLSSCRVSQAYGNKGHTGVDLAAGSWSPIYAVADGIVTASHVWDGYTRTGNESYGNYVQILHASMGDGNSYSTLYAHMIQAPSVSEGMMVSRGTVLGYVGTSGNSTGYHLHLEMKINGSRVNPLSMIPLP